MLQEADEIWQSQGKVKFSCRSNKKDFYLQLFEGLFPTTLLYTMVDGVNETMKGERLTYGELLRWIGLWTMMSTVAGTNRHSFWSTRDIKFSVDVFLLFQRTCLVPGLN